MMKRFVFAALLLALLGLVFPAAAGEDGGEPPDEEEPAIVETVAISGVQVPERFALPETKDVVCESEGVALAAVLWQSLREDCWTEQTGPFAAEVAYRVLLELTLEEGFAFAEAPTATVNGEEAAFALTETGGEVSLEFRPLELPFYAVRVTDGLASVNGRVVQRAQPGTVVSLRASILPDGQVFDRWVVVSGDAVLADETAFHSAFVMPEGDVELQAVFTEAPDPDACPYCGKVHRGFFGKIVRWFHKVLQYFRELR